MLCIGGGGGGKGYLGTNSAGGGGGGGAALVTVAVTPGEDLTVAIGAGGGGGSTGGAGGQTGGTSALHRGGTTLCSASGGLSGNGSTGGAGGNGVTGSTFYAGGTALASTSGGTGGGGAGATGAGSGTTGNSPGGNGGAGVGAGGPFDGNGYGGGGGGGGTADYYVSGAGAAGVVQITYSANTAPTITSGGSAAVWEGSQLAHGLTASDAESGVTWSIIGGADAAQFQISGSTLQWAGNGTKDYEAFGGGGDNRYDVTVRATDAGGLTADQAIWVDVYNLAEWTTGTTASVAENATLALALNAGSNVSFAIVGGADSAQFQISGSTLQWSGNGTRNFEAPADSGGNNVYDVTVRATSNNGNTSDRAFAITVTNVSEFNNLTSLGISPATPGASLATIGQKHNIGSSTLATPSPAVTTSALGQMHNIASLGIATTAPAVSASGIAPRYVLTSATVATFGPAVGTSAPGQRHALTSAVAAVPGNPAVASTAIGQRHALGAVTVATGTASASLGGIGQRHAVTAGGVTLPAPAISTAAMAVQAGAWLKSHASATITPGTWTTQSGGSDLHTAIDEAVEDDADYIKSTLDPVAQVARMKLDLSAMSVHGTMRFRYRIGRNGGGTVSQKIRLMEGAAVLGEWQHQVAGMQTFDQPVDAALVTNPKNLFVEVEAG